MTNKSKTESILTYLLIYSFLLFSAGFSFAQTSNTLGQIIILCLILMFFIIQKIHLSKKILFLCSFMIINIIITHLCTGMVVKQVVFSILILVEAYLTAFIIDPNMFCSVYTKLMIAISIVSLIGNFLFQFFPAALKVFPIVSNSNGYEAYFMGFSMVANYFGSSMQRNQGIFWEPGAFQMFLCLAYIFELYLEENNKKRNWVLILFLVSFVSTGSTTGIIVAVLLILQTINKDTGRYAFITVGIGVVVVVFLAMKILPLLSGFWEYTIVTKIDQVLNYQIGVQNQASSRMDSVFYVLGAFIHSPVVGIGVTGYEKLAQLVGHSMFTCTPINWFANYGVLYGIVYVQGLWYFFKSIVENKKDSIICFFIVCVSLLSEEMSKNIVLSSLMFMGFAFKYKWYEKMS